MYVGAHDPGMYVGDGVVQWVVSDMPMVIVARQHITRSCYIVHTPGPPFLSRRRVCRVYREDVDGDGQMLALLYVLAERYHQSRATSVLHGEPVTETLLM